MTTPIDDPYTVVDAAATLLFGALLYVVFDLWPWLGKYLRRKL